MNINYIVIGGNITRELEVKYTPSGTACLDISIANNHVWFNDAGEKKEEVCFVEARIWGKAAETVAAHFGKGSPILLEGRLTQERWEDKATGKARSKTLLRVNKWHFAGQKSGRPAPSDEEADAAGVPRGSQRPHQPPTARTHPPTPRPAAAQNFDEPISDGTDGDDIPF
jgi:single-strand DNA-binding protein